MNISYSKNFIKQAKKLPRNIREKLIERISRFSENPLNPLLRNHKLKGTWKEYGSINVTGDYRALYYGCAEEVIFDCIGTHAQLYE